MSFSHRVLVRYFKPFPGITLGTAVILLGVAPHLRAIAPFTTTAFATDDSLNFSAPVSSPEAPTAPEPLVTASEDITLPDEVRERVLQAAAADLDISVEALGILRYSQETWSDGCLGLGQADEACLFALVDGWQVEVVHNEESWFYRTDLTGEQVRLSTTDQNLPPSVRDRLFSLVSTAHQVERSTLAIASAEPRIWDGCLGILPEENTYCTDIGILGWEAVVSNGSESWVYHLDGSGAIARQNLSL